MTLHDTRSRQAGFTLIEVLCAMAIAGFLSTVAYPFYKGTVHKLRRADARIAMLQVQMAQERYRADHAGYAGLADIGVASVSPARHYTLAVSAASDSSYQVIASAAGSQSADVACRQLRLSVDGANVSYTSGADGASINSDAVNKQCWSL